MKEESTSVEPQKVGTVGDKGSPWEMFKRASPVQEVEEVASTNAKNPWDMFRESRIGFFAEKAAKRAKQTFDDIGFERVFSNLIQAESGGRHYGKDGGLLTSPVGAKGITQIMPETAKSPGYGVTPLRNDSEEEYLRFGRDYLSALVNRFDGDYRKAIASYNAGVGNVDKAVRAANRKGGDWVDYLPKKSETIPYMNKILGSGVEISPESIGETGGNKLFGKTREELKSLPKTTLREIVVAGLDTEEGRKAWLSDKKEEARREGQSGDISGWLLDKYPTEANAYFAMKGTKDITEEELAVSGASPISFVKTRGDVAGFVIKDSPDRAYIDPARNKGARTRLHEAEHVRQHKPSGIFAMKIKSSPGAEALPISAIGNYDLPIREFERVVRKLKEDPRVSAVFPAANAFDDLSEVLANYAAYQVENKKDMFKSELFEALKEEVGEKKAKEFIRAANSFTLTDIPQFTESQVKLSGNLKREIEKDKSYATLLYEYLKEKLRRNDG